MIRRVNAPFYSNNKEFHPTNEHRKKMYIHYYVIEKTRNESQLLAVVQGGGAVVKAGGCAVSRFTTPKHMLPR